MYVLYTELFPHCLIFALVYLHTNSAHLKFTKNAYVSVQIHYNFFHRRWRQKGKNKTDLPMFIAMGPPEDIAPNDPMAGEGSAFSEGGRDLGSSYPCSFFLMRCIAIENSFLSIFPSLFMSANCLQSHNNICRIIFHISLTQYILFQFH